MFSSPEMQAFLHQRVLDNRIENILWAVGIVLAWVLLSTVLVRWLSKLFFKLLRRAAFDRPGTQFVELVRRPVGWLLTLLVLYTAVSLLRWPRAWEMPPTSEVGLPLVLLRTYQVSIIIVCGWVLARVVDYLGIVHYERAEATESRMGMQMIPFLRQMVKAVVYLFTFFVILGNVFDLDIGSIVAGLGIGGLAVALAGKETLENLFAAFIIFLDRPFVVGDFVQVDDITGTIERVGFRSTRIRTADKSALSLPNKQMIDQALDNLTTRTFRRARYELRLVYDTPPERVEQIVAALEAMLHRHPRTDENSHVSLRTLGPHSLDLLVIYFIDTADFFEFNKIVEGINLETLRTVRALGGKFAFPTTSVYLNPPPEMPTADDRDVAAAYEDRRSE
ncbi:MAG: mechanosensitive ion channel family protein [Catalinimonas sp.]